MRKTSKSKLVAMPKFQYSMPMKRRVKWRIDDKISIIATDTVNHSKILKNTVTNAMQYLPRDCHHPISSPSRIKQRNCFRYSPLENFSVRVSSLLKTVPRYFHLFLALRLDVQHLAILLPLFATSRIRRTFLVNGDKMRTLRLCQIIKVPRDCSQSSSVLSFTTFGVPSSHIIRQQTSATFQKEHSSRDQTLPSW
jgi:hypothetical protein